MAEKEYIERGALLDEMRDCKYAKPESDFQRGVNASVDILTTGIKHLPTADVVEVVRCEKCVWWERCDSTGLRGSCQNPKNGISLEYTDNTDFCSYGERKEQE